MRRVAPVVLAALVLAAGAAADNPGGPFYLVPSTTHECDDVKNCAGVAGPWVYIPAGGEATYLLACRARRNFAVGGTDARVSRSGVRVWYDGKLGGALGSLPHTVNGRATLLFHARAYDGREAAFQPILGCVNLVPTNRRSTLAVPGKSAGAPLDLRTEQLGLRLNRTVPPRRTAIRCPGGERLVGAWSSLAFQTTQPPSPAYARAVTVRTRIAGGRVHATISKSHVFNGFAPLSWAQIGAMCQP